MQFLANTVDTNAGDFTMNPYSYIHHRYIHMDQNKTYKLQHLCILNSIMCFSTIAGNQILYNYTVSQKKVRTFKFSVTLSHLNRFSKTFALLERVCNSLQNPYDTTHLTLGMLLQYLGKLKIQIFCRCGTNRKQFAFLTASNFVIHQQILIFSVSKIASLSPY